MYQTVHKQRSFVNISGPTGYVSLYSNGGGFVTGTVSALTSLQMGGGGYFDIGGAGEVFCQLASSVIAWFSAWLTDAYWVSKICVQKAVSTCQINAFNQLVCTYYSICSWPNCSQNYFLTVVGAVNSRYLVEKKWRETASGVDCFWSPARILWDWSYCDSCSQSYGGF